jgi:hypothetical protein
MNASVKKALTNLKKQKLTVSCMRYDAFIKNQKTLKQYLNTKIQWYVDRLKMKSVNQLKNKYGNVYNINVLGKIRKNTRSAEFKRRPRPRK